MDGSLYFYFIPLLILMLIEGLLFVRLHEWCTKIGLRTVHLRGHWRRETSVDRVDLEDLGFRVKVLSDQRFILRPPLEVEDANFSLEDAHKVTRRETVPHLAVLTVESSQWSLEVFMPWVIWVVLLAICGMIIVHLRPGGTIGSSLLGIFVVVALIWTYMSGRRAYQKVVELMEWCA